MFAASFYRLLWKEYRVHRALWLSCLIFGLVMQLSFWLIHLGSGPNWLADAPILFAALFSIGSGAVLFASEREERTSDWLLSLAAPPFSILSAKYLFAFASTLTLQWILSLLSFLLLVKSGSSDIADMVKRSLIPWGLFPLLWSTLGSILSRRVLTSIATAAVCYFVICGLLIYMASYFPSSFVLPIFLTTTIGFTVTLDLCLGWQWCRGNYLDGSLIEAGAARLVALVRRREPELAVARSLPVTAEFGQPWRRVWQRLVWQERHRESGHLLLLIACGALVLLDWLFLAKPQAPLLTLVALLITATLPLTMGILGFRADRDHKQPQFLENRGVSPESIWLAKQFVWLPRAFWIPAAIGSIMTVFHCLVLNSNGLHGAVISQFARLSYLVMVQLPQLVSQSMSVIDIPIWFVLLGYACGQLTALLFRRVILAIGAGLVLSTLVGFWMWGMFMLEVPRWYFLGLPFAGMMMMTFWQMRYWLAEDNSWSRQWRLSIAFLIGPLVLVPSLALYRICEVSASSAIVSGQLDEMNQSWLWEDVNEQQSRRLSVAEESARERLSAISRRVEVTTEAKSADDIIEALTPQLSTINRPLRFAERLFPAADYERLNAILSRVARMHLQAGELDKSLNCQIAVLTLARVYAARAGSAEWLHASLMQRAAIEHLLPWSEHPGQSSVRLNDALRRMNAELVSFPSLADASFMDYLVTKEQFISSSTTNFLRRCQNRSRPEFDSWPKGLDDWAARFGSLPWERLRYARLLEIESQIDFLECQSLADPSLRATSYPGSRKTDFTVMRNEMQSISRTTYQPVSPTPWPLLLRDRTEKIEGPRSKFVTSINDKKPVD